MKIINLLESKKLDLFEIFDSPLPVQWIINKNQHRGTFLINEDVYIVHLDEYVLLNDINLVDIGFTFGEQDFTPTDKHTPEKVLGTVIHSLSQKIKELNPDCVLFGAHFKNKQVDKRLRLYERIWKLWGNPAGFIHVYNFSTNAGRYMLACKEKLTNEQQTKLKDFVKNLPEK